MAHGIFHCQNDVDPFVFFPFAKYFCHWRGVILPNANEIRSPTNFENCVHYDTCMFEKRKVVVYTLNIRARPSLRRIVLCTTPYMVFNVTCIIVSLILF